LLVAGADVNSQDPNTGDTPLMIAARTGRPDVVDFLIEKDANKHLKNKNRETALSIAQKCINNLKQKAEAEEEAMKKLIDELHSHIEELYIVDGINKYATHCVAHEGGGLTSDSIKDTVLDNLVNVVALWEKQKLRSKHIFDTKWKIGKDGKELPRGYKSDYNKIVEKLTTCTVAASDAKDPEETPEL
jgi:ankyrin repeat protein